VKLALAAAVLALSASTFPVTTLPQPPFAGPVTSAPDAKRLIVTWSRKISPGLGTPSCELTQPKLRNIPDSVRGLPLQRTICPGFALYGKDGASVRILLLLDIFSGKPGFGFDFKNYVWPPKIRPGEREFVYEEVVWAGGGRDGIYYVENAHLTYARSSFNQNAYITAINHRGKRLWRSKALVANSQTFAVGRDYLVTGYGFTAEPDWLYLLDPRTGRVVERLRLPSAPERIEWIRLNNAIRVRTYDHVLTVRLKES
jgi:hypothetical protein